MNNKYIYDICMQYKILNDYINIYCHPQFERNCLSAF